MVTHYGGGKAAQQGAVAQDRRTGHFTTGEALTDMQRAFVDAYMANGGQATKAAITAGYDEAKSAAYRLPRNPAIIRAIREHATLKLQAGTPVALDVMMEIMQDRDAPAAVRLNAAKWTLEATGHGIAAEQVRAKLGTDRQKSLNEMSVEELEAHIARESAALDVLKSAHTEASAPVIDVPSGE